MAEEPYPWHLHAPPPPPPQATQVVPKPPSLSPISRGLPLQPLIVADAGLASNTIKSPKPIKINFSTFLDAFNPLKLPDKRKLAASSRSSDSTIEIPRPYPPGYYYCWYGPEGPPGVPQYSTVPPPFHPYVPTPPKHRPHLDGHNNSSESDAKPKSKKGKKKTVIVLKHYCAQCGRPRSKRYQREHPAKPGVLPVPKICSRCRPSSEEENNETTDDEPVDDEPPQKRKPPSAPPSAPPPQPFTEEVEEVLIRRGRGRPSFLGRKRPQTESVRVTRLRASPPQDPAPEPAPSASSRKRPPSSSESFTQVRIVREESEPEPEPEEPASQVEPRPIKRRIIYRYELDRPADEGPPQSSRAQETPAPKVKAPPHPKTRTRPPSPPREPSPIRVRVHVRTRSASRNNVQDSEEEAFTRDYRDIDRRIAAHPNAWSHGRMVPVEKRSPPPPPPQKTAAPPSRSPSPPEWYYRKVRRHLVRSSAADGQSGSTPSSAAPSKQSQGEPRPGIEPKTNARKAVQNGYQSPRGCYPESSSYRRYYHHVSESSEDDGPRTRVSFAAGTKTDGAGAMRRQREEVKDWEEAKHDQHDFNHAKSKVRHRIHQGAGALELDGHRSEEAEQRNASGYQSHENDGNLDETVVVREVQHTPRPSTNRAGSYQSHFEPIEVTKPYPPQIRRNGSNISLPLRFTAPSIFVDEMKRNRNWARVHVTTRSIFSGIQDLQRLSPTSNESSTSELSSDPPSVRSDTATRWTATQPVKGPSDMGSRISSHDSASGIDHHSHWSSQVSAYAASPPHSPSSAGRPASRHSLTDRSQHSSKQSRRGSPTSQTDVLHSRRGSQVSQADVSPSPRPAQQSGMDSDSVRTRPSTGQASKQGKWSLRQVDGSEGDEEDPRSVARNGSEGSLATEELEGLYSEASGGCSGQEQVEVPVHVSHWDEDGSITRKVVEDASKGWEGIGLQVHGGYRHSM